MHMPARPLGHPVADQWRLMGCVIVHDAMNVQTVWNSGFDLIEKLTELFGAMAPVTLADDPAGCDVQGGKPRCGAMALVVVTTARPPGQVAWAAWSGCAPAPGSAPSHRPTVLRRPPAAPRRGP